MNRPNIVYLNSHDTGRYVQPYGHAVATPHLQRFAEEGVLFRNAHANAPTCSPSRAALLTGRHAHEVGMLGLCHRGFGLTDYDQHLSRFLQRHGYTSVQAGIQHVAPWDAAQQVVGYDEVLETSGPRTPADAAEGWLRRRPPGGAPFFLEVGFFETHRTNGRDVQWHNGDNSPLGGPRHVRPPAPLPDTPEVRRDFADYAASAGRLDAQIGQVLRALADAGHEGNTIVVITTDHGLAFPKMKGTLTDHGTGVMLMMRGPHPSLRGGRVVDAMVQHLDVFPTLCDATGLTPPDGLAGRSLQPLLDGDGDEPLHEAIFAEVTYHAAYEPKRSVRTARWKYIRHFDPDWTRPVLPNVDPSVSKDVLMDAGWHEAEVPREQLFDLVLDPNEAHNLAGDARHRDTLDDLRRRLDDWMVRTDDPLRHGAVPLPPGADCNPRAGRQPSEPPLTFPDGGDAP
jgi:arylsulfatase A-like enzyme